MHIEFEFYDHRTLWHLLSDCEIICSYTNVNTCFSRLLKDAAEGPGKIWTRTTAVYTERVHITSHRDDTIKKNKRKKAHAVERSGTRFPTGLTPRTTLVRVRVCGHIARVNVYWCVCVCSARARSYTGRPETTPTTTTVVPPPPQPQPPVANARACVVLGRRWRNRLGRRVALTPWDEHTHAHTHARTYIHYTYTRTIWTLPLIPPRDDVGRGGTGRRHTHTCTSTRTHIRTNPLSHVYQVLTVNNIRLWYYC